MAEESHIDGLYRILPGESLSRVPVGFVGPVLIEVDNRHRSGRGRWWRPKSNGYTDIPGEAGVYTYAEAAKICAGQDRVYMVDPVRVADIARRSADKLLNAIEEVRNG